MGFWNFMRDMFVFDWLFGHNKEGPFWEHNSESNHYTEHLHNDDYYSREYGGYSNNDYAQQDFDDDLDSGMFENF